MNYPSLSLSKEIIEGALVAQTNCPKKLPQNNETLKCAKCDYKTVKKNYLDNHNRSKHPKSKINCFNCDFTHAFPRETDTSVRISRVNILAKILAKT